MSTPSALGGPRLPPSSLQTPQAIGSANRLAKRAAADPQIVQAAEGMETMFLDYMMQVMRKTIPENEMDLESPATKIYRGMLDSEYAQMAAKTGGVGLADQIIAYLEGQRYNLQRPIVSGTGGTQNESQSIDRKSDAGSGKQQSE